MTVRRINYSGRSSIILRTKQGEYGRIGILVKRGILRLNKEL